MPLIARTRASLAAFLRRNFLTGLLVLVPSVLSLWFCWVGFHWFDQLFARAIGYLHLERAVPQGVGFLVGAGLVLAVGAFANNFVGQRVVALYEAILEAVPILNRLFPALRQISRLVFAEQRQVFDKVVLVEYPKADSWAVGFLAAKAPAVLAAATPHDDLLSIFVPTTPNPTSGFLLLVPPHKVQVLDMSPEDAFKLVFSGGLLAPEGSPIAPAAVAAAAAPEGAPSEGGPGEGHEASPPASRPLEGSAEA